MSSSTGDIISCGLCMTGTGAASGALLGLAATPIGPAVGALMGAASGVAVILGVQGVQEVGGCINGRGQPSEACIIAGFVSLIVVPLIAGIAAAAGTLLAAGAVHTFSAAVGYGSVISSILTVLVMCGMCCATASQQSGAQRR